MINPYETSIANSLHPVRRRPVRRYLAVSSLLFGVSLMIAIPGIALLNQEWQLIYDVEINGQAVSNENAILYTVGAGLALCLVGLVLGTASFLNWRHNRRLHVDGV